VHVHIRADEESLASLHVTVDEMFDVVGQVVNGSDSGSPLVVAIYLMDGSGWAGETHFSLFTPATLHNGEMRNLPPTFRLIQIALGQNDYPYQARDDYGWQWRFATFLDHLAAVVAHELYHYTQPSFASQRTRNEHDANQAALDQVHALGYAVEAQRPARGVRR
jgi:hypothetical protein